MAGQALEAANVYALGAKVARLLETIAPARALPLCYFRVPAMDYLAAGLRAGRLAGVPGARRAATSRPPTWPESGSRSAGISSRPATYTTWTR